MRQSDPASGVDELITSVWVLAALAAASDPDSLPEELGAVLFAAGCAERTSEGWCLLPAYRDIRRVHTFPRQVAEVLRQAADAAEGHAEREKDDDGRLADGALSGVQMSTFLDLLENRVPALHELLHGTDLRFLDVGVGVGGIAGAILERIPTASAVGLDVDNRMLELAGERLEGQGLSGRVELRQQDVTTLTDQCGYDLAWLPLVALAEDDVLAALPRIRMALRPGGWLVSATAFPAPDANPSDISLRDAIIRWRTARRGVTCWDAAEMAECLASAGYRRVHVIEPDGRGMSLVAAEAPPFGPSTEAP